MLQPRHPNAGYGLKASALAVSLLLGACAVGPDFKRPEPPALSDYDHGELPIGVMAGRAIDAKWWGAFSSPQLDKLVDDALAGSPNLAAAEATLRESEAERRAGAGIFYPNLSLDYSAQRERSSPAKLGIGTTGSIFNLYTLGASIAYSLDLFGGNRRAVEALSANVDQARYDRDAARLALIGNVVDAAISYAAYGEEISVTQHEAENLKKQLALIHAQVDAGVLPLSAALTQRSQLDALLATLPPLQEKHAASRHLLATLMGKAPSEWQTATPSWGDWHLPNSLPLTLPSELVRQRPDILAAEAQLHAATANVGVATANLFPSITLGATGGWSSNQISTLGSGANRFWSVGPDINLPLFSGGADWAKRDSAKAALAAAAANYRQTVVNAFGQVADVLTSIKHDGELANARKDAMDANENVLKLAHASKVSGNLAESDYLSLDAQLDAARLASIDAEALRLQDAVALHLALGGSWQGQTAQEQTK